jgi:pimeloyl-ACP methyl ester carboxylesterase
MLKSTLLAVTAAAMLAGGAPAIAQPIEGYDMQAPAKTGHAPVNGVEVYYQVYGEGEPLVLLHGGFGAIEMFMPILGTLAERRTVIGIDLQGHGRTLPHERPMTFSNMAADVAGVIRHLGYDSAEVMGYSMGGATALRLGIEHPQVVDKLILVSTPYAFSGWHDYNQEGMRSIGAHTAEPMKQTPMYEMYAQVAPDPENNWVKLHTQMGELIGKDYDWSDEVGALSMPTMLVVGDWDSVRTAHAAQFFELLGGGRVDGGWAGENMNRNRLAILPGLTHYNIFMDPLLATVALSFLDAPAVPAATAAE